MDMMLNKKCFYPALFHRAEEGGFWISFPDLPECLTQGEDMAEAYEMASDALGLALEERLREKNVPQPSVPDLIVADEDSYMVIVEYNPLEYCKKHSSKAVKKTLSIPGWLNEAAMAKGINFSAVLQEALKAKLNL